GRPPSQAHRAPLRTRTSVRYDVAMARRSDTTPFPERARSLTPRQVGQPVTQAETPIPVRTWILTVRGEEREVDAEAIAWTPRAVRVAYTDKFGRLDTAWVWASAVRRR